MSFQYNLTFSLSLGDLKNHVLVDVKVMDLSHSIKEIIVNNSVGKFCVSLSGGVDSMCLLHALHSLLKENTHCLDITALHINYNNRDNTDNEVSFVQNFCDKLSIKLNVLHILDIKRTKQHRAKYEEYTRKLRFEAYSKENCPIFLGHNFDDTVENIISNISSCKKYENLKGMSKISHERNVQTLRPFLDIPKSQIYAYADTHNIPHLQDSTPKWSRRGKLRDHVIPCLMEHEPNFVSGLLSLCKDLAQNYTFIQQNPNSLSLPPNILNAKQYLTNKCISHSLKS